MKELTDIVLKRIIKFTITLVLIVLLFLIIRYIAVPISRPFSSVRDYVLKLIPVSTSDKSPHDAFASLYEQFADFRRINAFYWFEY